MGLSVRFAFFAFLLLFSSNLWACPTCGLAQTFTPLTLLISTGFFIMPVLLVLFLAYRLRRDQRMQQESEKS